ncbi:MAG: hypothetical protein NVV82_06760 [Sporocytophaga sp.]|jgi:hypothetical protein|nr:hypothetical protein [Sporocytophaga sp.]
MRRQENIENLRAIQDQIHENMFSILVKSKVISHLSSTIKTQKPLFQFTTLYDLVREKMPTHADNFLQAFHNLLKANFLYLLVVDRESHQVQFMLKSDYNELHLEEKMSFSIVPMEIVLSMQCLN